MNNYLIRRNLSRWVTTIVMLSLPIAQMLNQNIVALAIAVPIGVAVATVAHRLLFPQRWADE